MAGRPIVAMADQAEQGQAPDTASPARMRNLTILNSQPLSSQHDSMMVDYNQGLRASARKLSTQLLIELHPIICVATAIHHFLSF